RALDHRALHTFPTRRSSDLIFGEKALNVKDTSLRVGPNEEGTVIGVNVLTRHGVKKDERTQMIELQKIEKINRDREEETTIMERDRKSTRLNSSHVSISYAV